MCLIVAISFASFNWCTFDEKYCEKTNMKLRLYFDFQTVIANIRKPYPLY